SGAIALAIAQEVPRAQVHAVEADPLARPWAARNIAAVAVAAPHTAGRVTLHEGDFAAALAGLDGTVDLVISNPPYLPSGTPLAPEVSDYDPPRALWGGGSDGLAAIRVVAAAAARLLRPGGLLVVEHDASQGPAVYWLLAEQDGWRDPRNHPDLTGHDRFVTATWQDERL
ncbi:MAG: N5-glutamine methyltransferase family protein, partial [Streptosporangiaceae bacterium]